MNIQEVRAKYPQYSDLSDQELVDGLHAKYYSDVPKAEFYSRVGLGASTKPPAATAGDRTMAGVSGVNRGIAGLVGLPVDTAENLVNLGIAGYGTAKQAITGQPGPDLLQGSVGGSQNLAQILQRLGVSTENPRPDDAASRMLHTGGVIAGGSLVPGARPLPTAAAATSGAVAGEVLGPQWVGPAAMAPAAAVQAGQATKAAIADRVAPRIQTFKDANSTPSVGQATELNFIQGFENLLSKFPGGQGVFRKFAEGQQKNLGEPTQTGVSASQAGRQIERGVQGFMARSKETWNQLDAEVSAKIPKGTAFEPSKTVAALDELTSVVAGAEKTTGGMVNPKIADIKANLAADLEANSGRLPYEAMRQLRSRVGGMLDNSLTSDIPNGQLKKLYGALSQDLEVAANQAGAGEAFTRQNNFYRSRMERIEGTLNRVLGPTPEETFKRFMPSNADEETKVRQLMRSLDPEQRHIVQQAVVSRLGKATPGKQDAGGDIFSPETFLTNWNKLSPGAKQQIFSDPVMRKNMDSLAAVSENLRGGAKVFANPSGSAGAAAPYGMGYLLAVGNVATVGTLAGGAMIGAKMLTSPKVVEWLAQYPKVAPEAAPVHLARLGVIYNETKDPELKQELSRFVSSVK